MIRSRKVFIIFYLAISTNALAAHICYFSLNNDKEIVQMKKLTDQLNKVSSEKIEITEFMTEDQESVEAAFKKMADNAKCDGLVISGHHTGSFAGERAHGKGELNLEFMEKLSCDPKYESFFSNIKALWLQGCRTLGVGKIESTDTADFHMNRVGGVLEADHLTQSFAQLNIEFSATLDKDYPLSSRYLRVFPRATTFGWTATAPGKLANSEYSVPFHIAHMARLNDDRKKYFDNPITDQLPKTSLIEYTKSLMMLLGNMRPECSVCRTDEESKAVQAWKNQGNAEAGFKYALKNNELNAFASMENSNNPLLKRAKELECQLKNAKSMNEINTILDEILADEALIGYNFNSLFQIIQQYKQEGKFNELNTIQTKLKSNLRLNDFLMRKIASKELGIIRKIDYYTFWKEMSNESISEIELQLQNAYIEVMTKSSNNKSGEVDQNILDFKETLNQSMAKNNLLDAKTLRSILLKHSKDNNSTFNVVRAIEYATKEIKSENDILLEIIKNKDVSKVALVDISYVSSHCKHDFTNKDIILRAIINSPKANAEVLHEVIISIRDSKFQIKDSVKIAEEIIKSPKMDLETYQNIKNIILMSEDPSSDHLIKLIDEKIESQDEK